jgi:hypothetical protein
MRWKRDWIAGLILAGFGLGQLSMAETLGWRPKQGSPSLMTVAAFVPTDEPFDWRDDLYGPMPGGPATLDGRAAKEPSVLVLGRTGSPLVTQDRCTGKACPHCGLGLPVMAVYPDGRIGPDRSSASAEGIGQQVEMPPAWERIRLGLIRANNRLQDAARQY